MHERNLIQGSQRKRRELKNRSFLERNLKKKKKMMINIKLMENKPEVESTQEDKKVAPAQETTPAATQASAGESAAPSGNKYGDEEDEETKTVKLTGSKVKSADEEETLIYIKKAKLYRFRDGKWKERGEGYVKLLRTKENKIRFLQRAEKTLKVTAHFFSKSK